MKNDILRFLTVCLNKLDKLGICIFYQYILDKTEEVRKVNCPNCGSTNIEEGVSIGKSAESGSVGPKFNSGLFLGVAQMYCDICLECGEITRLFIKESTDKKWFKKPGTLFGSK